MNFPSPEDDLPLVVEIANRQSAINVATEQIIQAVRSILSDAGYTTGEISVAIVDDPTIHQLNRQYLQHDYPTDVLAFVLEGLDSHLDGEIVVSAETAQRNAMEYHQTPQSEILLYVIHGALHLVGYNDSSTQELRRMRNAEQRYLRVVQRENQASNRQ